MSLKKTIILISFLSLDLIIVAAQKKPLPSKKPSAKQIAHFERIRKKREEQEKKERLDPRRIEAAKREAEDEKRIAEHGFILKAASGNLKGVQEELKKGIDLEARNQEGRTALLEAALAGKKLVVETLLNAGANINATDHAGYNALILAAARNHPEVANLLIIRGIDIKAMDFEGNTALMKAAEGGYQSLVELLLKAGVNIDAKDKKGQTALMKSVKKGHKNIVDTFAKWNKYSTEYEADKKSGFKKLLPAFPSYLPNDVNKVISEYQDVSFLEWMKYVYPKEFNKK